MDAPRIKAVLPLAERRLRVTFVSGIQKVYDCTPLIRLDRFRLLKEEAFFKAVRVDAGGYGISWSDAADLSEYELWARGTPAVYTRQRELPMAGEPFAKTETTVSE